MPRTNKLPQIVDRISRGDSVLSIIATEHVPAKVVLEAMRIVHEARLRALENTVDLLQIKLDAIAITAGQIHANLNALLTMPPNLLAQRMDQVEAARKKNPMTVFNFPDPRLTSDLEKFPRQD